MINPLMKRVLLTFAVILSFLLISCPSKTGNELLTQFEKEKNTIFVTQDNWSSSGEVWIIAYPFTKKLNSKLIGTHSGGMQVYGNCVAYMENGLDLTDIIFN